MNANQTTIGIFRVVFTHATTGTNFTDNFWATDLDHLYEQINDCQPQLRVLGPDAITRIS
jgi:hypothetical protein